MKYSRKHEQKIVIIYLTQVKLVASYKKKNTYTIFEKKNSYHILFNSK